MPRKKPKGRIERRVLADGSVAEYRYGPRPTATKTAKKVSTILGLWENSQEFKRLEPMTQKAYIRYAAPLYDALKTSDIDKVKRRHLLGIRDDLADDRGHGAAIAFCKVMAVFFGWAVDREYVQVSPVRDMKKSLIQGELRAWTMEQALKAENELPSHYARIVFLARWTAQRRGDLCKMLWSDYQNGEIYVCQEKTGAELMVPVAPPLAAALAEWIKTSKGDTILQQPNGYPINPMSLSVRLPIELERIGLSPDLGIHGVRKLAASSLADAGCSTHEIAAITGHKTLSMVAHYTKSADQRLLGKSAMDRLVKIQMPQNMKKSRK